jgi:surface carbohydrate biosynthesis protein (TIGR04326 family)
LNTKKTVIIIDRDESINKIDQAYLWTGYNNDDCNISLLHVLENNSDLLRSKFLHINNDIVSTIYKKIHKSSSVSSIELGLIWSSLLVEKSVFKSQGLLDIMRLLALDIEIRNLNYKNLHYIGPHKHVAESLRLLCENVNATFCWKQTYLKNATTLFRRIWKFVPDIFRSVIFIVEYAWRHWKLKKLVSPNWHKSPEAVLFFLYFVDLDRKSSDKGKFNSEQWGALIDVLIASEIPLNFAHIFLRSELVPDTDTAIRWVDKFNRNKEHQGIHTFLDSFFGWGVLFSSIRDYFRCYFLYKFTTKKIEKEVLSSTHGWLWPVLRQDWQESIFGVTAMQNILSIHLCDKVMASLPHQRVGLYQCENQGWERAFISAWRKHGHGKLIGVTPTTISYWDLRYFDKFDTLINIPQPDIVAINGLGALNTLKKAGQPMGKYAMVEALRYFYFNELKKNANTENTQQTENKFSRLLVLGDVRPDTTHRMMSVLEQAITTTDNNYVVILKPHPANAVDLSQYPLLQAKKVDVPLYDLFSQTDQVFTSVFTSAGIEAYYAGFNVINYLDPNNLNWSLLRNVDGVEFISSSQELAKVLDENAINSYNPNNPEDFFWLDKNLPRWKKLLGL